MDSTISVALATMLRSAVAGSTSDSVTLWKFENFSVDTITAGSLE